jgi:hypothetical protein
MANGGFGTGIAQGLTAVSSLIGTFQREKQMALKGQELAIQKQQADAEYGPGGLAERRVKVSEDQVGTAADRLTMEQDLNQVQIAYNKSMALKPVNAPATLTNMVKQVPETQAILGPILSELDNETITTRRQLRDRLLTLPASPKFQELRGTLREKAAAAQAKGDMAGYEKYNALYTATGKDGYEDLLDTVMQKPPSLRRSASAQQQRQMGVGEMETYTDPNSGATLKRNKVTGDVEKVSQRPTRAGNKGFKVNPDGTVEYWEGSRTPASTVEKQASLVASIDNLEKMEDILKNNPDADVSGFWEFANKFIDDWDIMDKQDLNRSEFRQRTAMALKFMYDVMGRQLAVQELRKGQAMLPQMDVDEKVNLDRIQNLMDYMKAMMVANQDKFTAAGYNFPPIDPNTLNYQSKGVREAIDAHAEALKAMGYDDAQIEARIRQKFNIK